MSEDSTNVERQDFDGADVVDASGNKIGTVSRTYDDDTGATRLIEVRIGTLLAKHRLLPFDNSEVTAGGSIQVPYDKETIENSPDAESVGDTLEGDFLDSVMAYYGSHGSSSGIPDVVEQPGAISVSEAGSQSTSVDTGVTSTAIDADTLGEGSTLGAVRDLGDVIEIPIVEEVLVKRQVVKEVLRIRKRQVTERQTIEGDVRKEEIEVVEMPDSAESGTGTIEGSTSTDTGAGTTRS